MLRSIGLPELLIILAVFFMAAPAILYLVSLQRALSRCAPSNRAMDPALVWLMIIPIFGLVWHFFIVNTISTSLRNEYRARNWQIDSMEPGKSLGLAVCILPLFSWIPFLGLVAGLAGIVCWIMYWVKIERYSVPLSIPVQLPAAPPPLSS